MYKSDRTRRTHVLLSGVLAILIPLILTVVSIALRTLYPNAFPATVSWIGSIASLAFLILMALINRVGDRIVSKSRLWIGRDGANRRTSLFRRIRFVKIFTFVWVALILLGLFALHFFTIQIDSVDVGAFIDTLLQFFTVESMIFVLYYIFSRLIGRPVPKSDGVLPKEDFPRLYELAERVKGTAGIRGELAIVLTKSGEAFARLDGRFCRLTLGIDLLAVLSEEELNALLIRSFGALLGRDPVSRLSQSLTDRFLNPEDEMTVKWLLFALPAALLERCSASVQPTAAAIAEKWANDTLSKAGDGSLAAAALCKSEMHRIFLWNIDHFLTESPFQSKEFPENAMRTHLNAFQNALQTRAPAWRIALLSKELPDPERPIFRERWEGMGSPDFAITLPDLSGDSPYVMEVRRCIDFAQEQWAREAAGSYPAYREENYCKPLENVENFRRSGKALPEAFELGDLLYDCGAVWDFGLQEALCNRAMAALSPIECADASFFKGQLLIRREDPAGVDLLLMAADLRLNLAFYGLPLAERFCRLYGLAEKAKECRRRADQYESRLADAQFANRLSPSDCLSVEDSPDALLPDILKFIEDSGEDALARIYFLRKTLPDGRFIDAFVLDFKPYTTDTLIRRVTDRILSYLDCCDPTDRTYSVFHYPNVRKAVETVPGCLVWQTETVSEGQNEPLLRVE